MAPVEQERAGSSYPEPTAFNGMGARWSNPVKPNAFLTKHLCASAGKKVLGLSSWREADSELLTLDLLFTGMCPYKVQGSKK